MFRKRERRRLAFVTLLSFVLGTSKFCRGVDTDADDFDFISIGSEYWGRLQRGFGEIYDYGELLQEKQENPDIKLNISQLVQKYGYPFESHQVFTEDDYVLTLHRIPHGRLGQAHLNDDTKNTERPVVFLHHGLCSSSVDWIMNTVDKALPYMLADAGWDVWLGNARGNKFSRRHIRMTSKRSKFWDFSWHEIGKEDIPSEIDYVLKITGQATLDYIGHSMGTSAFFVAMSLKPEYNSKIRKMIAMGPAVHLEDMKSPLRYLAPFSTFEKFIYDLLGNGEILPDYLLKYMHRFAPSACTKTDTITAEICDNIMYAIGGYNPEQMNLTQMPVILAHTPASCSTKSGIHYLQTVSSEKFRQYDYGIMGNIREYSQLYPPSYDLSKVTAPVSIFWAENDILCDPKGIRRLEKELPNLQGSYKVNDTKFTHIDYIFAKDADKLVYKKVLNLLELPPKAFYYATEGNTLDIEDADDTLN